LAKNNRIHGITDRSTADSVVEGSEVYGNGGYGIDAPGSGIYVFGNEAANNTLGNYNQSVLSGAITIQDLPALTLAETPFNILFNVDITG
jgi:hypothetical protein